MEYKGKYRKMAEQFRRDGADEITIARWIREEMERDEAAFRRTTDHYHTWIYQKDSEDTEGANRSCETIS